MFTLLSRLCPDESEAQAPRAGTGVRIFAALHIYLFHLKQRTTPGS